MVTRTLSAQVGYEPLLCKMHLHRWRVCSGTFDIEPTSEGLRWGTKSWLCIRCGRSREESFVVEWPNYK